MPKDEVTATSGNPETCEACGAAFGCGVDQESCWCNSVAVPAEKLAELRGRYSSCLCPSCLARVAGGDDLRDVGARG